MISNQICRYLSLSKTDCGFDSIIFMLLQKKIIIMNDREKLGIFIFDEIFLRESVEVNSGVVTVGVRVPPKQKYFYIG